MTIATQTQEVKKFNYEPSDVLRNLFSLTGIMQKGQDVEITLYEHKYRIRMFVDRLHVGDITNAGRRGKECLNVIIHASDPIHFLLNTDVVSFCTILLNAPYLNNKFEYNGYIYYFSTQRAIDIIPSKSDMKNIYKPLKEIPKRFTKNHVIRALVNRQFEDLHCDGYYTDDYAYDASVNFRIGEGVSADKLINDLIRDNGRGWHYYTDNNDRVHVNLYHFDLNSFKLVL